MDFSLLFARGRQGHLRRGPAQGLRDLFHIFHNSCSHDPNNECRSIPCSHIPDFRNGVLLCDIRRIQHNDVDDNGFRVDMEQSKVPMGSTGCYMHSAIFACFIPNMPGICCLNTFQCPFLDVCTITDHGPLLL